MSNEPPVVLETAAQAFADANATAPFLYQLDIAEARKLVDSVQSEPGELPPVEVTSLTVGGVPITITRPAGVTGPLPVILYIHGLGWVFGGPQTHGRLVAELAYGTGAAVVFPDYSLSPEAQYPVAIEEIFAVAQWIRQDGAGHGLDPARIAIAGDSVGGNMAAATTLLAKERGGVSFVAQVLFYPVTDANFDTDSYRQFAEGYFLRREGMYWFWDQYTTDPKQRAEIYASPLRATLEQLAGLPPALIIVAEADVLRDEGEAYANKLRAAGVAATAVRYQGIIHDFVGLNPLRGTSAAAAAITQAVGVLKKALEVATS